MLRLSSLALAGILVGCGSPEPEWFLLDTAEPVIRIQADDWAASLGCRVRLEEVDGVEGMWLEWDLRSEVWEQVAPGAWRVACPGVPQLSRAIGGRKELRSDAGSFRYKAVEHTKKLPPGAFGTIGGKLHLRLAPNETVPSSLTYSEFIPRGKLVSGAWRVTLGKLTGNGLPVWPGERWQVSTRIPPNSALRFHAVAGGRKDGESTGGELLFTVRLDGIEIWRHARADGESADAWHTVPFPKGGGVSAVLEFAVEGMCTQTAFLDVTIGPAKPELLRDTSRPNIILFLADTFRADNLSAYGGNPDVTPFLNRLSSESVLFERSWSTSTWTLPAQASFLTSLHPPQHGADLDALVLSRSLTTIAEVLERYGYRTGAVTDGVFISAKFGFDQGFRWFHETDGPHGWNLNETLERAFQFLRSGDGRPTFLFVHTYRTHEPYRVGEEESLDEVRRYRGAKLREAKREDVDIDPAEVARDLLEIYRKGATDLDRKLGRWVERLRPFPDWARTYFIFTSDHGEAFYEHTNLAHRGTLWEETFRIPLLIAGPNLTPASETDAASLIDLAPTMAALARAVAPESWQGVDLLSQTTDRTIFGFYRATKKHQVAIVEGNHKVLSPADVTSLNEGRLKAAFDLAADPKEQDDLLAKDEWPALLGRKHASRIAELLRTLVPAERLPESAMDDESLRMLRELGYGGD